MSGRKSLRWTIATAAVGILVVCSLSCSGCASTDGSPSRGGRPTGASGAPAGPSVSEIIVKLNVAEEHRAAVKAILEEEAARREELMSEMSSSGRPDRSAMENARSEMEAIQRETEESLTEYLTEEQMEQYRAFLEESRETTRPQSGDRPGERPPGGFGGGF